MDGTIQTISLDGLKVHVYTSPDESLLVNSTVFELADRLIVVDGQIFQRFAREYKEIAQITGSPIGTVMSRLHRGRQALKTALSNSGFRYPVAK